MVDKLIEELKKKHGKKLDLNEGEVFYLFLKDGLFSIYYDEDEKTIKVDVEFLPGESTFIYFSDEKLENLLDQ